MAEKTPSIYGYLSDLRKKLIENQILVFKDTVFQFDQNYVFNSPSAAAGVVLGKPANGRQEWKTEAKIDE